MSTGGRSVAMGDCKGHAVPFVNPPAEAEPVDTLIEAGYTEGAIEVVDISEDVFEDLKCYSIDPAVCYSVIKHEGVFQCFLQQLNISTRRNPPLGISARCRDIPGRTSAFDSAK
jgi:hypothetical protein